MCIMACVLVKLLPGSVRYVDHRLLLFLFRCSGVRRNRTVVYVDDLVLILCPFDERFAPMICC